MDAFNAPATLPNALLVIAHPDDECMFFGPLLRSLRHEYKWHVLCLSTGNADGLGSRRRVELQRACSILQVNVHAIIDDPLLQDGMQARWDHRRVQQYVASTVNELQPVVVSTFDELGVSGHPNHIAVHYGVKQWYSSEPTHCRLHFLRTIPTAIKFLGPFVLLLLSLLRFAGALKRNTALGGSVVVADSSSVLLIKGAMQAHESQYVWYRRLFIQLSVYPFLNVLRSERKKDQ